MFSNGFKSCGNAFLWSFFIESWAIYHSVELLLILIALKLTDNLWNFTEVLISNCCEDFMTSDGFWSVTCRKAVKMSISHIETALKKCETRDQSKLRGMALSPPLFTINNFSCNCKQRNKCLTMFQTTTSHNVTMIKITVMKKIILIWIIHSHSETRTVNIVNTDIHFGYNFFFNRPSNSQQEIIK